MAVGEQLIEECLTRLRELFKLVELDDWYNARRRQVVISLQYLPQIQKLSPPLLLSGFLKRQGATLHRLNHKTVLSLFIPLEENIFQSEIVHPLQLEVG